MLEYCLNWGRILDTDLLLYKPDIGCNFVSITYDFGHTRFWRDVGAADFCGDPDRVERVIERIEKTFGARLRTCN